MKFFFLLMNNFSLTFLKGGKYASAGVTFSNTPVYDSPAPLPYIGMHPAHYRIYLL